MKWNLNYWYLGESFFPSAQISLNQFSQVHEQYKSSHQYWSASATQSRLIGRYWLEHVIKPLFLLMGLSTVLVILFTQQFSIVFISVLPSFLFTLLILSLPVGVFFYFEYLPHLSNLKEAFEAERIQGIQKCKKEQYPVLTLILIQVTFHHLSGCKTLSLAAPQLKALTSQYGVSQRMVDNALRLVLLGHSGRISERKRTEIRSAFGEARAYFTTFQMQLAHAHLDWMEQRLLHVSAKKSAL